MPFMKSQAKPTGLIFLMMLLAGCASTQVAQETPMAAPGLARPNQIWVYDFVAASSDMPADSSLAGQVGEPSTPPTPEEIETGRKYGAMIAQELVKDINNMGMSAVEASPGASPQVGDGVIRGYIVSTEGGGAKGLAKRFIVGFGAGTTQMETVVEGYVMTKHGLKKLGSGTVNASGNKAPGLIVPAAVAIASSSPIGLIVMGGATVYGAASGRTGLEGRAKATADKIAAQLKIRFQKRGWIAQG